MNITLDVDGAAAIQAAFERAPAIVDEELRRFLTAATQHLESEVKEKERTPTAHGLLRNSIFSRVEGVSPSGMLGVVGSSNPYVIPVELGTKPHWVPIEPLIDWVKQKLPVGQAVSIKTRRVLRSKSADKAARRAAYAIQHKIAAQGTAGAFMFTETMRANEARVAAGAQQMMARIAARMVQAGL